MRLWNVFRKCMLEQKRDLWVLGLSLAFAPLFVYIYYLFTGGTGSTSYGVLVINHDLPVVQENGSELSAGEELVQDLREVTYENGSPLLRILLEEDRTVAEKRLRNREAVLLIIIPESLSQVLLAAKDGRLDVNTSIEFVGDLTNPYYTIAAVMAMSAADELTLRFTGEQRPVQLVETPLGASAARTEFENYIPGLFIMAVILMIFQASMTVAREIEGGKLRRLQLTRMTAFDLLGGTTAWLVVVSVLNVLLTFITARACGFRSEGQLWIAILVGVITSFSIIGSGLIVACFSKTVSQAFVIANFPLGFYMFLSGSVFPLPKMTLFTVFGHAFTVYDILPPTHAVTALNKVFTLGASLGEVAFELVMLCLLSAILFAMGVVLFQRMHLRAR